MAPAPRHPSPLEQLSESMREAKLAGLSFEEAWGRAVRPGQATVMTNTRRPPVGAIRWPTHLEARREWRAVVVGTKRGWRRAYNQMPVRRRELALLTLGDVLTAMSESNGMEGGGPLSWAA